MEGFLVAWDPAAQKPRWRIPIPKNMINGGTPSTAGNLVFSGVASGLPRAHSADKGEQLWDVPIGFGLGTPMTYELDGKQYVSILAGAGVTNNPGVDVCARWPNAESGRKTAVVGRPRFYEAIVAGFLLF